MLKKTLLIIALASLWTRLGIAQNYSLETQIKIDSLELIAKSTTDDSVKIDALFKWDALIYSQEPDLDIQLNTKIFDLCSENISKIKNQKHPRLRFYIKSKGISAGYLGIAEFDKGNASKALQLHQINLDLSTGISDSIGISGALNNIAIVYQSMNEQEKAIPYLKQSLEIRLSQNDNAAGFTYNNLGLAQKNLGNLDSSMTYFNQGLKIFEEANQLHGIALILGNKANLYKRKNDIDSAIIMTQLSIDVLGSDTDLKDRAGALANLGDFYLIKADSGANMSLSERNKWRRKSIESTLESLEISNKQGYKRLIRNGHQTLCFAYKGLGEYEIALDNHILFRIYEDSVNSEANQKELIRFELKADYEKQAAADSVKSAELQKVTDAQIATQNAQISKDRIQKYSLWGGIGLVVLFGLFVLNRLKISQKQNAIIDSQKSEVERQKIEAETQKDIVEEKNREILDSISYAKRIQNAILPSTESLKNHLKNGFILYKPKDVVAGDFYWMEKKENKVLFAAADCTGHGVPGAMVSVVCNNALNRSVREFGLEDPGKILDKTREIVIQEFETNENTIKDGMDIALCSLSKNKLEYAGAHNPLWLVRDQQLIEYKADKQPIGRFDHKLKFRTHHIELIEGDTIYIFSDGYVDQFGGAKGKKFKPKAFRELILKNQHLSMDEQRSVFDKTIELWRGSLEQVDDICIIGVKF